MNITSTKINSVTVYSDRAQIVRSGKAQLIAGVNLIKVGKLSPYLISSSVQASIKGDATLKELKSMIPPKEIEELKPYHEEILELENQIAAYKDQQAVAKKEQEILNQLLINLSAPNEKTSTSDFDLEKWSKTTQYNRQRQLDLGAELRKIKPKLKEIEYDLLKIKEKAQEEIEAARSDEKGVEIWIESEGEQEVEFELSYLATRASWLPQYDINIIPNEKKLELSYNAIIRQSTQEDWDDVKLHLSTAKVSEKGFPPKVETQRIWLEDENDYFGKLDEVEEMATPAPKAERSLKASKKKAAIPPPEPQHKVDNFLTTVSFDAAENTSIVSSSENHKKVAIMQMDFPVEFKYTATPKLSSFTYLKARLKNNTQYPLLSGQSNVFLGNSFVTSSKLPLTHPNEKAWVFLGVDETVKIEHRLIRKQKAQGGFLKKNKVSFKYSIDITNTQGKEISITIWEQLPLSENKSLVVELIQPKIVKGQESLKLTDKNIIEWNMVIPQNEKVELPFEYNVEYPLHHQIGGLGIDFED